MSVTLFKAGPQAAAIVEFFYQLPKGLLQILFLFPASQGMARECLQTWRFP